MRGVATGLLTATLAVAAHGAGGGAVPGGAASALLAVLAVTVGALTLCWPPAAGPVGLAVLLAAGQLVGHGLLGAATQHHAAPVTPTGVMVAAHLVAVVVAAGLIAAGDRLCRALCHVARAVVRVPSAPIGSAAVVVTPASDHPSRATLLLAASVTHRGPPVGLAI